MLCRLRKQQLSPSGITPFGALRLHFSILLFSPLRHDCPHRFPSSSPSSRQLEPSFVLRERSSHINEACFNEYAVCAYVASVELEALTSI